jgi:hypothetical protein
VRLHVPLPSIAQGSTIKFMSLSPETPLEGRVLETELTLCRKTQAFELSLVLEPSEPARRRRYTVYDQPVTVLSTSLGPGHPAAPHVPRASRWQRALIAAAVLLGGLGWFVAATRPVFHMTPHHVAVEARARPPERVTNDGASSPAGLRVPAEATGPVESRTAKLAADEEPAQAPVPVPAEQTSPSELPVQPARVAEQAAQPAAERTPTDASSSDPSFSVNDELNEVFVPVHGSLATLRTAVWAEPSALVVDLPDATATLTHARYSTHTGCVLGLSVGKPRGTMQLRVYLSEKGVRYTASESPGGLLIRVRCAAESSDQSH